MMKAKNYKVISYIDDFLCVEDSRVKCQESMTYLSGLIERLGLKVNPKKTEGPAQILTFLGVSIDVVKRTLSLPAGKLKDMKLLVKKWLKKSKCVKRDLQRFIGKLHWCARVVRGGRTFIRRLINLLCTVKRQGHHIRLTAGTK